MEIFCAALDTKTKTKPKFVLCILLLCLYLKTQISLAADTINVNHSLSGDQTVVSAGRLFILGFFKPGNVSNYYIGMWYYNIVAPEKTIVWVANREHPVSDRFSSVLSISDGNLVLFNESRSPVWSTNVTSTGFTSTTTSDSIQAVLLDNGNLVLRAGSSSSSEPLWQSFDHPAHTMLPGSRIGINTVTKQSQILTSWKNSEDPAPGLFSLQLDPNGTNSCIILWNRSKLYWTSGTWDENSKTFSLVPEMRLNYIYNFRYVSNKNKSYFTYSLYNSTIISRFMMDTSGQIKQLSWLESSKQWNLFWSQPKKQCEVYAYCGAFGSCTVKSLPFCNCLMGFEPKSKISAWDLQDYSGGCSRRTRLHCGNDTHDDGKQDGFLAMRSVSLPENKHYMEVGSYEDCESICLNNCSCTAFANDSSGCSTWSGELLGLQQLVAGDSDGKTLYLRLAASELSESDKGDAGKRPLVIALVSATAGLLTIIFGYFLWKKILGKGREHRRKYGETRSNVNAGGGKNDTELPLFGLRSILSATHNFSEAHKLGEGGFGPVYKGILAQNQEVAIKRLSKKSGQGHEEFLNELKLIAKLQHTNLVRLLGCCNEEDERILIYEYMPNRSLDKFLFDPSEKSKLDWGTRFQIIEGIVQGLIYIHKYSRLKIIHRDLKSSNILLDGTMNPKISDFGMAKIFELNQTEANTNRVVGTYGYMSPEYALYGDFSEKLDVFSFGVLLLEIISGKRNANFYRFEHVRTLAGWAWELWKEGRGMEVIDESVRATCRPHEALRCIQVGFLCVQEAPADRPTMSSVIHMLQGNEVTSLPPSKQPAFSTHRISTAAGSSQTLASYSNNTITLSIPEGR